MHIKSSFILLILSLFTTSTYNQSLVYSYAIPHTQHITATNPDYNPIFSSFTADPNAHISVFYTLNIKVYQEKENQYSINISYEEDSVTGNTFYKLLTLSDLFYPKRIFVNSNLRINNKTILTLHIQNKIIPENCILLDTIINYTGDSIRWSHKIEYLQFYFDEHLAKSIASRTAKIDAYYQNDSLFYRWNKELDKLNLSNVDLLPIYKFNLDDIEKEATVYVNNQFENLLVLSNVDNTTYIKKVSKLFNRINTIKNYLKATLSEIDEMLYRKGEEFEKQNNYEKAVYYYQRTLDYNPTHCQACLALSNYFINQKNYTKPIILISNLYKDTSQKIENHTIANNLYQILLVSAEQEIKQKDYYSALKTLDTLENYCILMPPHFCDSKYKLLQEEAKQGIYNAYVDVIRQAIRNERFSLAVNYTQGLGAVMRKNDDTLDNYHYSQELTQQLWDKFTKTTYEKLSKKQYSSVLAEVTEFNNFLDTSDFHYPKTVFDTIYTFCYTHIYIEKNAEIENIKKSKQTKGLAEKIKDTEDFYQLHKNYIQSTPIAISEKREEKTEAQHQNQYNNLCLYLNTEEVLLTDYNFLDSCILALKWQQNYLYGTCLKWDTIIKTKCNPIVMAGLSRANTYAWGNEFTKAYSLYVRLHQSIISLSLDKNTTISLKYQETKTLLQTRGCAYLKRNQKEQYENALIFIDKKNYIQAQKELQQFEPIAIECATSSYDDSIPNLLTHIEKPAYFQNLYQQALDKLSVGFYEDGFVLYEQASTYYSENTIQTYGLTYDNWMQFLTHSNNTNYYIASCEHYIKTKEFSKAIDIMMLAASHNIPFDKTQNKLGEAYLENIHTTKQSLKKSIHSYSFSQKHTSFLNAYLGKARAYFYLLF